MRLLSGVVQSGLVWKTIKPRFATKENGRKRAARVAQVEALLKPFPLNKWRKSLWKLEQLAKAGKSGRIAANTIANQTEKSAL